MTTAEVDSFSSRLKNELDALDWQKRNELLLKIGKAELRMRSMNAERPTWKGPTSEERILGSDVVVQTDQGERRGRVICFGVTHMGGETWERSVIVNVPSSGTQHEVPGSATRLASAEDVERIQGELEMANKLAAAADAASKGTVAEKPRRKGQRDPQLVERMLVAARESNDVKTVEESGTNYKITGVDPHKKLYLFKSQLRVDLSGYTIDHPGVRKISDEEARDMHLGKVRGQLTFDDRTEAFSAFEACLAALRS